MSTTQAEGRKRAVSAHVLLLATVAVWGATFGVVKNALRDCTPLLFNALRMTLAFAVLAAVHAREWRRMDRRALLAGVTAGLFLASGYALQTVGLVYTTAARSAFLTGLVVVLVPILSAARWLRPPGGHAPGVTTLIAAAGALAGIVLLTTPAGTPLTEFTRGMNRGDWLSLGCAVAFALHLLSLAHLAHRMPTAQLATLQIGFAALFLSAATPWMEAAKVHWTGSLVFALLLTALLGTAAAFSVQSWAQKHLQASHTALIVAMEPAFALLSALLFFGERLSVRAGAGAALILLSLLASELLSGVSEQPEANVGAA